MKIALLVIFAFGIFSGCVSTDEDRVTAVGVPLPVAAAIATFQKEKAPPEFHDSVVIDCNYKTGELTVRCGSSSAKKLPNGKVLVQQNQFIVIPMKDRSSADIEVSLKGCDRPQTIQNAERGMKYYLEFQMPCRTLKK